MNLTPEEVHLIQVLRDEKPEFGEIHFVAYYRHDRAVRIEVERVIESKMVKEG